MRFYWLLPSFLSVFVFSLPAEAGKLVFWRFDSNQNRLEFRTNAGVQPRAILISDPTRLIIDLPGTKLGRPTVTTPLGGAIRSLRVGQFDDQTTRLVIELHPGYTLDPKQVLFRGASPIQWSVQIPTPQRVEALPDLTPNPKVKPTQSGAPSSVAPRLNQSRLPLHEATSEVSGVQIQNLQVTRDGFFFRTNGGNPGLVVTRNSARHTINIDLKGASLFPSLFAAYLPINSYGVSRYQLSQLTKYPRVDHVAANSQDWQASLSSLGEVVRLPQEIPVANKKAGAVVKVGINVDT